MEGIQWLQDFVAGSCVTCGSDACFELHHNMNREDRHLEDGTMVIAHAAPGRVSSSDEGSALRRLRRTFVAAGLLGSERNLFPVSDRGSRGEDPPGLRFSRWCIAK